MNSKEELKNAEGMCVYYNSACPVCNAGVNYQKQKMQNCGVTWKDVHSDQHAAREPGTELEYIRERLHVINAAGELKVGMDAFIALWENSAGEAWKARLFSLPVVHALSVLAYNIFAWCLYKFNRLIKRWEPGDSAQTFHSSVLALHMGSAFNRLAPLLQKAHVGKVKLEGSAKVEQGNVAARLLCRVFNLPRAGENVHLLVQCDHDAHSMRWQRYFNKQSMYSHFKRKREFLIEHLGPLALYLRAVEKNGELHYQFMHTRFFGLPLPAFFGPRIEAWEKEVNGRYHFSVRVHMFPFGLVIAYSGALSLEQDL